METENPFSAPITSGRVEASAATAEPSTFEAIARKVFLEWEKLRLIYVAVLVVATLGAAALRAQVFYTVEFWATAILGAFVTNMCFFCGPAVESYLTWIKAKPAFLRMALFVIGTIASVIVAMVAVFEMKAFSPN